MMRNLLILLVALAAAVVPAAPARAAETAEVVYDDGRPSERVPLLRVDGEDGWFLRAGDVARLFRATQFWNASSRKIVLGIGKNRFVLTVDTRVVVIDGEPFMMRTEVRYGDGVVLVPMEFVLEIAADHTPRKFAWDDRARRLSVQGIGFNVTGVEFDTTPSRTTATFRLTEPLVYHVDSGTPGLVRLKIYGARADVRALTTREPHGLVRAVRAEQSDRDAFVSFDVSADVKTLRVDRADSPPRIVVTLDRTASAEADTGMVVLDEGAPVGRSVQIRKVCIDAGHGGRDRGHESGDVVEKDVTLAIAKAVAAEIEDELGLEVVLTRNDDRLLALRDRTEIANRSGADLFISIHCNSWFNEQTGGFESYFFAPARGGSTPSLPAGENPGGSVEFIAWDVVQNAYISESSTFAETLQREMTSRLGIKSRGVKQANMVVLQGANMPAVLLETAFLSNPEEAHLVVDPDFQRRLAEGVVASIRRLQEQYR